MYVFLHYVIVILECTAAHACTTYILRMRIKLKTALHIHSIQSCCELHVCRTKVLACSLPFVFIKWVFTVCHLACCNVPLCRCQQSKSPKYRAQFPPPPPSNSNILKHLVKSSSQVMKLLVYQIQGSYTLWSVQYSLRDMNLNS